MYALLSLLSLFSGFAHTAPGTTSAANQYPELTEIEKTIVRQIQQDHDDALKLLIALM